MHLCTKEYLNMNNVLRKIEIRKHPMNEIMMLEKLNPYQLKIVYVYIWTTYNITILYQINS